MDNFATINIGQDREDMPLPYEGRESIQDGYLRGTDVFQDGFAVTEYSPFDDVDDDEGQTGYPMESDWMDTGGEESTPVMEETDHQDSGCGYRIGGDGSVEDDEGISPIKKDAVETDGAEAEEERKRAEHEASEAKRKAEWEARQQEKREARKAQMERIRAMSDEELAAQSMKRVEADTEKLTRRNMKECVSEYIQTACLEDAEFARQAMLPQKNMVRCFQYINRKAYEYVQDEIKANGIHPGRDNTCYASDVPDDLCYHWAEEYFRTMDVKEDEEEEERFVPKPYMGKGSPGPSSRKTAGKKAASHKPGTGKVKAKAEGQSEKSGKGAADGKAGDRPDGRAADRRQKAADDGQLSFIGQMTFSGFEAQEVKAG
nr:Cas9 inhibitor AcrIIA9 family protein [uncultured Acetatifactor sp.]